METVRVVCAHDCPDMCSLLAHVEDDKVIRVQGDPDQPYTAGFACAKVNRDAELVHSPERLTTPLRRTGPKGSGQFEPISWEAALDEIASRWTAIIAESGPEALLGYAYSAHQGQMNRHIVNGLFHALGASRLQAGTVCDTCCETAWDLTLGPVGSADPESVVDSDLVIAWGCDLMAVNVHFWAKVEALRKKGVKVVVIDPRRSRTAASADWHLPIRIGTDAALVLGIVHILVRDGLCDRAYLAANTLGFEPWERDVVPRFTPEYTAAVTGLAIADIEKLAAMYGAAKRSFIRIGEGMTRLARGGQALRAVASLPAVTGAYGRQGGGALLMTAASMDFKFGFVKKPSGPATARQVNHLRLGDDLLNLKDPPLRSILIAANNPAVTCPEANKVRAGLSREDLFVVVHDPFMTDTARYADIVLPATTYLETQDFYRAYGSYYMQYAPAAVAPQGQAWSNFRLAQALARRLGLTDPVFRMSEQEILPEFFRGATGAVAHVDPAKVIGGGPIKVAPSGGQEFRTPSGKLEIYSAALAAQGLSPLPDWQPDEEEVRDAARWPLRLLTAPSYFQPHTAYSGVQFLRKREGEPFCVLNPSDAARRNLADGQKVRLYNERAAVGLILRVGDEITEGVILVPGQRPGAEAVDGTINMLCSDRLTDMGEGACYQSTFLDVEAWDRPAARA
ncbi:molybdopterin-containing oxidoreductase family protein [Phreatobacter stygius]|uniref:Molybdopterin oxidoreductase family protein n=1 Tax=Phreatobacter stygius TaxID=1940610 RepID=A0A4D7BGG5_9HYPH|nr:molybdopterin-dependent oxidoreductase [Phreatobacter stygius]QCI66952.1 molybdopterin oxidoreductase family protein [Phreatobacter stygius]